MKKLLVVIFLCGSIFQVTAYDKLSLVERFTNCSCGPCASINNAWYNTSTANLLNSGSISHIVYHVYWPSPGECDPMHLLNEADNNTRTSYYGVNAVPWIEVNGNNVSTSQTVFENAVATGNSEYAPFNIILTPERFSNEVINVHVKIIRDPNDNTTLGDVKLRVALTEKYVQVLSSPCCTNGETEFHSVCRKMLPNASGTEFTIPSPGDSTELDLLYIPTTEFLQSVNFDSIRVVSFIQSDDTQEMYQSAMADLMPSNRMNAAFQVEENLGASPLTVNFTDFSTATDTSNIISWEWDFDNDGTIDSQDPNPTWTYTTEQTYTVSLTVSDGMQQHTRTINNYIMVLGASSEILIVNGIAYATYTTEMENFYNSSACFGNHQVDVWDLFGDQGFDYSANANIQQINLLNRSIPNSILNLYRKVIWIGNSFGGDEVFYDPSQVLEYIGQGGNFLLATREGAEFFNTELRNYCGITQMSGLSAITQLIALDDSLVNMTPVGTNDRSQFLLLDTGSEAIPIFDDNTSTNWIAGFRIQKGNDGVLIYIAGRPYRFDNNASYQNYDFIIDNMLNYVPLGIEDETSSDDLRSFRLFQNYPNPFNPTTTISYVVKSPNFVKLKIFDALGREVKTIVNEFQTANIYSVKFDAGTFSTGIYYYKLQIGDDFEEAKKMLYLK
jgi:PKD repeat protein